MTQSSFVSITDLFCGAGGSSIGATQAGGELVVGLNHWAKAIETHATNFPQALHDCTDVQACDPRRYPATTILIASPECVNHSLAKGQKKYKRDTVGTRPMFEGYGLDPAGERSRATMWDVPRFAEIHDYSLIIVENVLEARKWRLWDSWWHAMTVSLGYDGRVVYFNSQFAWPTPQSRDRMYAVFWKRGQRAPNLDFTPAAWCPQCAANVASVQSWKKPGTVGGRFDRQYLYCCPVCAQVVRPYYYCAANAIDWTIPNPRIGDRKQPLKEKTLQRIATGLKKFGDAPGYVVTYLSSDQDHPAKPTTLPWPTQTATQLQALAVPPPFLLALDQSGSNGTRTRTITDPHPTQTTTQAVGMVIPFTGDHGGRPLTDLWPTQTAGLNVGLLVETKYSHATNDRSRGLDAPWPAQTSQQSQALVTAPFIVEYHGTATTHDVTETLPAVTAEGNHHALAVAPFLVRLTGAAGESNGLRALSDPLGTQVAAASQHALVQPAPFLLNYQGEARALAETLTTVTTVDRTGLITPAGVPEVEDCGFRILQAHEVGRAMAFPTDYKVLGTKHDQVRQYGNAVTPPVMRMLLERCLETLS